MQILLAILILCFVTLVWAGVAVARRIYAERKLRGTAHLTQRDFTQHLFSAAEAAGSRVPRSVPNQTVREIMDRKSWNQPAETVPVVPGPSVRAELTPDAAESMHGRRKSPQASHQGGSERLDWAYFNKDMGDLTDPYQTPRIRANSRISAKRS